jgi:hypothetical protein
MSRKFSYVVKPSENLQRINSKISYVFSSQYERGSLQVYRQKGSHVINFRTKDIPIESYVVPGSNQSWNADYFPQLIKVVFNQPIDETSFPYSSFYLNAAGIPPEKISVDDDYVATISLTSQVDVIVDGNNRVEVNDYIYSQQRNQKKGNLWNGKRSEDTITRSTDFESTGLGYNIKIHKISVPKSQTSEEALYDFQKNRNLSILDNAFISAGDTSSLSGWLYIIYIDNDGFTVKNINPSKDSIVSNTSEIIEITFSSPIQSAFTSAVTENVFTTLVNTDTTVAPSEFSWSSSRDVLRVTPDSSTMDEGLHYIVLDLSDIYDDNGNSYVGNYKKIWSSYYVKTSVIPKTLSDLSDVDLSTPPSDGETIVWDVDKWVPGEGGGGGDVPADIPVVTWEASPDLTNEKTVGEIEISDLKDAGPLAAPGNGDFITWNGTWSLVNTSLFVSTATFNAASLAIINDIIALNQELDDYIALNNLVTAAITDGVLAHTSDVSIHFTTSDLTPLFPSMGDFNSHTSDTNYHYLKSSIKIGDLSDVNTSSIADGKILKWNGTAQEFQIADDNEGAGGALSNAYTTLLDDDANSASADGGDTIKLRSANTIFSAEVGSNDPTHGDNILFTVHENNISHDNLSGTGEYTHADIDDHINSSDIHNSVSYLNTLYPAISTFNSHTSNAGIHFTTSDLNLLYPSITNFNNHTSNVDIHFTTSDLNSLYPSISDLSNHTSDSSIHFTINDLNALYPAIGDFSSHTSDTTIHFTTSDLNSLYTKLPDFSAHTADFSNHTSDTTIHFTTSDLTSLFAPLGEFNSHTSDTSYHFTKNSINIGDLADVNTASIADGKILKWNSAAGEFQIADDEEGEAGAIFNAYTTIEDGDANSASPDGSDNLKFRSADSTLAIQVSSNDPTHGDNVLFTLNPGAIEHSSLSGTGEYTHIEIDEHINSSDIHNSVSYLNTLYPSIGDFNNHTSDGGIHFTTSDLASLFPAIGDFSSHTSDTTIHFTTSDLNSLYPQILDFNNHTSNTDIHFTTSDLNSLYPSIANFNSHTSDTTIHFTTSDLTNLFAPLGDFNSHTSDTSYHFLKGDISIGDLSDVNVSSIADGKILKWNSSAGEFQVADDEEGEAGAIFNAYTTIEDGDANSASPDGSDNLKFRSDNNRLTVTVGSNDATHGDNVLFTLNEGNIEHDNLSGTGQYAHSDIDDHINSSDIHNSVSYLNTLYPSISNFNSHTSDVSIHFTTSDLNSLYASVDDLSSHTSDTDIHFTIPDLDILYPAIGDFNSHTSDVTIHFTTSDLNSSYAQLGDFNAHTSDGSIHFTEGSINHGNILGLGNDDHTQYHNDTRGDVRYYQKTEFLSSSAGAGDAGKPVKLDAAGNIDASMINDGDIDHTAISNIGTNTHAQIDSHIADTSIHFTEGSIDHTAINNIGTNTHAQIDSHIGDDTIHFTTSDLNSLYAGLGNFNNHTSDGDIHFTTSDLTALFPAITDFSSHTSNGDIHFTTSDLNALYEPIGNLSSHTSDASIHFTTSDLNSLFVSISDFNNHTSNTDYHYLKNSISIGDLSDVNTSSIVDGQILKWNSSAGEFQAGDDNEGAGGTLTNAYATISDGSNSASAVGADTIKFRTANGLLDVTVGSNDATHGDNVLFTVNESSINHDNLNGAGTYDHSEIDSHINSSDIHHSVAYLNTLYVSTSDFSSHTSDFNSHTSDSTVHFTENSIDHTNISNVGTNTHAQIDSHIADATLHFTEGSIDHTAISNVGTNTHAQIDSHIADTSIHFTKGSISLTDLSDTTATFAGLTDGQVLTYDSVNGWQNETPAAGVTDHTLLSNIGTNTHAQIDTHIGDSTIHFTKASIELNDLGDVSVTETVDHVVYWDGGSWSSKPDSEYAQDSDLTTLEGTVSTHTSDVTIHHTTSDLANTFATLVQFNGHTDESNIHFTEASIDHDNIQNNGSYNHSSIDSHIDDGTIHFTTSQLETHFATTSNFLNHTYNSDIHYEKNTIELNDLGDTDLTETVDHVIYWDGANWSSKSDSEYAKTSEFSALSSDFSSHTSDSNPHALNYSDVFAAPNDASFVVISASSDLTSERVLTAGDGISIVSDASSVTLTLKAALDTDVTKISEGILSSTVDGKYYLPSASNISAGALSAGDKGKIDVLDVNTSNGGFENIYIEEATSYTPNSNLIEIVDGDSNTVFSARSGGVSISGAFYITGNVEVEGLVDGIDIGALSGTGGASIIGIDNTPGYFTSSNVQDALDEIGSLNTQIGTGHYEETFTATSSYTVDHNLGERPQVTVLDSSGNEIACEVQHMSDNSLDLNFKGTITNGDVFCDTSMPMTYQNYARKSVSADYSGSLGDRVVFVDTSSQSVTITLPNASSNNGRPKTVVKTNASNLVVITGDGLINGNASHTLSSIGSVNLIDDDTNWWII